jgi:hypothetical protein
VSASSDNLRTLYPEFADAVVYPDADVDEFIGWAAAEMDATVWGSFFERGALALAAYLLKLAKDSAGAASGGIIAVGSVTSVKTGDLSLGFGSLAGVLTGVSSPSDAALMTNRYGVEYIRLRDLVVATPIYIC